MNNKKVSLAIEEANGIFNIVKEIFPAQYSEIDCIKEYYKIRYYQSIKGFKKAMPEKVNFQEVLCEL